MNKLVIAALIAIIASSTASAIDIDANRAVEMALESSAELKVAANAKNQAELQRGVARTAYLPNFAANAMGICLAPDMEMMGMTLNMKAMWLAGINVTQPIYAGGKIITANKLAGVGIKAAESQLMMTRAEVIANAQQSYWTYVAVLSKVKMMKSYVAQIDTAYNQSLSALNAGLSTRNDLQRIEAKRSQILYQLGRTESGADLSRMNLCHIIGLEPDTEITPADTDMSVELPENLSNYSVMERPEAALLQCDVESKKHQIAMTRADFLPSLGLMAGWTAYGNIRTSGFTQDPTTGNYVPFSNTTNDNMWSVMLSLSVPLWHWGEGIKKVKHAKIDAENARIRMNDNLELMNLEIQQAISNVNTGKSLLDAAKLAMTQADTNLANITQSYDLGLCSLTDMLDAQSQWHASASDLIEAYTQLRINCVEYLRVTGRLN